jgi:hypothetical protein
MPVKYACPGVNKGKYGFDFLARENRNSAGKTKAYNTLKRTASVIINKEKRKRMMCSSSPVDLAI